MIDDPELIEAIVITYLHDIPVDKQQKNFAMCLVDTDAVSLGEIDPNAPYYFLVINVARARIIAQTFSKDQAVDIARIENKDERAHKIVPIKHLVYLDTLNHLN